MAVCPDYTTTQKVADYLNVDVSTIRPEWIEWATTYIETFTCQKFCEVTVTEKYDITETGQEILMLDNYPILDVIELKDDGEVVPVGDYLIYEQEGFIKFADEFTGTEINLLQPGPFTFGRQRVEVNYKYGYADVPKDIEWVATVLTAVIASSSLTQSGVISGGAILEEEIGEYRIRRSDDKSTTTTSDTDVEGSKIVDDRLQYDVFSAKNTLTIYRDRKMRSV